MEEIDTDREQHWVIPGRLVKTISPVTQNYCINLFIHLLIYCKWTHFGR